MTKRIIGAYLSFWARLHLRRCGVRVIAVTGSVGKTTTKDAIGAVLSAGSHSVRTIEGNINGPMGVSIGLLGGGWDREYYRTGGGMFYWVRVCIAAPIRAVFTSRDADMVVCEFGADHPGDIGWLANRFPPHIAVVTAIGDIPVHVEFYESPAHVAVEKASILAPLSRGDHAVLNADDAAVLDMRKKVTRADVITFGSSDGADVRFGDVSYRSDGDQLEGVSFSISAEGRMTEVSIPGVIGRGPGAAFAAAFAVGLRSGMSLDDCVRGVQGYHPPAGRMRILRGIKGSLLIDDTYNAAPAAVQNALDALAEVPAERRIAVLGDMLELGGATIRAHEGVGNRAGDVADVLIAVGERARFIADAAGNQLPRERVFWFRTAREAGLKLQELLSSGDVVLIKGSQGVRMERVTKEVMADPGQSSRLLVRQSSRWLAKP